MSIERLPRQSKPEKEFQKIPRNEAAIIPFVPWVTRTEEQWKSLDPNINKTRKQVACLIFVAGRKDGESNLHDPDFLKRWHLDKAYKALFSRDRGVLDDITGKKFEMVETIFSKHSWNQKIAEGKKQKQQELLEEVKPILSSSNIIPFLMEMSKIRRNHGRTVNRQVFFEEAAKALFFDQNTTREIKEKYHSLLLSLKSALKEQLSEYDVMRELYGKETQEDQLQNKTAELIDAVISFPYWESWYISPEMTINRLMPYMVEKMKGYKKDTDGLEMSILPRKNREGKDLSMDVFKSPSADPAELVVSKEGYSSLKHLVRQVAVELELDARAPEMFLLYANNILIKDIAKQFKIGETKVEGIILQLRRELAKRIDQKRPIQGIGQHGLSNLWFELLDEKQSEKLKKMMQANELPRFIKSALIFALEKGESLRQSANGNSLNIKQARKDIIQYVAVKLREKYPKNNDTRQKAENTARRAIQRAGNLLDGTEEYQENKNLMRQGHALRLSEIKEWRVFAQLNPEWEMSFSQREADIIRLYYLCENTEKEGIPYTQEEVASRLKMDGSTVSRRLEGINKKRIRMGKRSVYQIIFDR